MLGAAHELCLFNRSFNFVTLTGANSDEFQWALAVGAAVNLYYNCVQGKGKVGNGAVSERL